MYTKDIELNYNIDISPEYSKTILEMIFSGNVNEVQKIEKSLRRY